MVVLKNLLTKNLLTNQKQINHQSESLGSGQILEHLKGVVLLVKLKEDWGNQ